MPVLYDDGVNRYCKLMTCITESAIGFYEYYLIVQEAENNNSTGFNLFQDYKYLLNLIRRNAYKVYGPCFVVETDHQKNIITHAKNV